MRVLAHQCHPLVFVWEALDSTSDSDDVIYNSSESVMMSSS